MIKTREYNYFLRRYKFLIQKNSEISEVLEPISLEFVSYAIREESNSLSCSVNPGDSRPNFLRRTLRLLFMV